MVSIMMKLSPLDIRNQQFKTKTFGGLDADEVRAFLNQIAVDVEEICRENIDAADRLKFAQEQISHYQSIEKSLQDTALTMQKVLEQKSEDAKKEAEIILAEARNVAHKETEAIRLESADLKREIQILKDQRKNYFIRMRSVITSQSQMLDALENDTEMY